jgi:hypothetical protein
MDSVAGEVNGVVEGIRFIQQDACMDVALSGNCRSAYNFSYGGMNTQVFFPGQCAVWLTEDADA